MRRRTADKSNETSGTTRQRINFDPLGWLTPLMVRNKHFFQQLWLKPYGWDDLLSEEDQEQWNKLWDIAGFTKQLPRKLGTKQGNYQLIACSDASTYALAAAVYIRQGTEQHLLIAKSKLPSLKMPHTIPKLEINALTIAGRLLLSTFEELKKIININTVYLLSDSEIALSWLKNESPQKATGVLVTNRIKEIKKIAKKLEQEGVNTYFGYMNTKVNPADCATRGLTAEELQHHIWWDGPPTSLTDENASYEGLERFQLPPDPAEVLQISHAGHPLIQEERFSSLRRLKRTIAYVGKFLNKLAENLPEEPKQKIRRASGIQEATDRLQGADLMQADRTIIKLHQKEHEALITVNEQRKLNITRDDKGTENPNQIRQVELRMSNGRVTKRPVNSLIPLELLDSDPDHEHLPTHENPPTPTELPSEPSPETPGRPKRNPSKQYPYSPEEYEINSISTYEKSVTQSNTSIFRMANDPNEFIDNFMNTFNERSSMFEESQLQRRLDVVYAEITKLIQQRQKIEEAYSQLKEKASLFDPDPARAKPLYDLKNELIAAIEHLKERWEKVQVVSHLLWEVYDSLVQRDASRFFSRQMFENRPRQGGRINSKDCNLFVIQEETQLLRGKQGALEVMDIVPFLNPHVETDDSPYVSEDVDIHSKLDDTRKFCTPSSRTRITPPPFPGH
ncbi:unnamed protein product [Cylicocyclus nassatus]|uniref:Uncharacterized protein n=1 Tax=Cylicocyclus nassatus TaxID=53992 RepID=A0AA36DL35_CYLNA|nr:unnamed protein product [Cylicocyclus nassatus]